MIARHLAMPLSAGFEEQDRADLMSLLDTLGAPVVELTPLSGCGYPGYRPTAFRARLGDGRHVKVRTLASVESAERIEFVSHHVQAGHLPRVLGRAGRALLTEWVDGSEIDAAAADDALLAQCGAVQGLVHSQPMPDPNPFLHPTPLLPRQRRFERRVAELAGSGTIGRDEARQTLALAERFAPRDCRIGFLFGDFCPENLVVRPSGELCCVDTETLMVGPCAYDLGRTWYRWPMTRRQRTTYLDAYQRHCSADVFVQHFPYWLLTAIVDSAAFRLQARADAAAVPIAHLRAFLHTCAREVAVDELVFAC